MDRPFNPTGSSIAYRIPAISPTALPYANWATAHILSENEAAGTDLSSWGSNQNSGEAVRQLKNIIEALTLL